MQPPPLPARSLLVTHLFAHPTLHRAPAVSSQMTKPVTPETWSPRCCGRRRFPPQPFLADPPTMMVVGGLQTPRWNSKSHHLGLLAPWGTIMTPPSIRILSAVRMQIGSNVCFCRGLQSGTGEVISKSFKPGPSNEQELETSERSSRGNEKVGAFQKLPMVMPSIDILASAKRKSRNIPPTKGITNIAKRERNRGAKQLDALMKELVIRLRNYMENFPKKRSLHPYERSLIELTLGEGIYEEVLGGVNSLRKKLSLVGKQHAALCAQSLTKREAEERLNEGIVKLEEVFQHEGKAIDDLVRVAKALRAMPVVDPEKPTLCLVGAPNVGKSSLVRILSTGKPEVCNYPFTTRGILMGHIHFNYEKFQVTDTPGLLTRKDDDRNNLEKLTLAVLSHLPTAVLFVHDLTGDCGTSPSDQFITYKEIKERFKDHLWLDVVSKCDLLQESQSNSEEDEFRNYKRCGPNGALRVSVKSGAGLDELKARVHSLLISQMTRIRSEICGSSIN